jgi:hypothetical protein
MRYSLVQHTGDFTVKNLFLLFMLIGLLPAATIAAQDGSTVNYYFAACETQAVIDLDGNMLAGYDLYVQVFDATGGTGNALTGLVRVPVDGAYQISAVLPYATGKSVLLGQFASARILIARESDPESSTYNQTVDDIQDTCIEPAYSPTGGNSTGGGTPLIDPITGQVVQGEQIGSSGIFTPDGGILNETYALPSEGIVQIGARPSELERIEGRTSDPGIIFAECDAYPLSDPGRLFDTDTLIVFWSWFARTPAQVQNHINTASYEVFLSSPYAYRQVFPNVQISPIVRREDGNYYVFYSANLGNGFRPGEYKVDYYVTWAEAITDGYDDFGPDTEFPFLQNTCTFEVEINPSGVRIDRNNPTVPLQQQ